MDFANKRFLVADEQERIHMIFQDFFFREGAQVETVSNVTQALDAAAQQRFDLAIIDFDFNGNNGFGLLDKLRRHNPDLPALIITGRPNNLFLQRIEQYRNTNFLEKPVDLRLLREKIIKAFA